jgi:hypothetical protein
MLRSRLAVLLLAGSLAAGCSTIDPESYAKVQSGMARNEVYQLLGEPDKVSGGGIGPLTMSSETWQGRKHTIHITFAGDKVALKSIASGDSAEGEQRDR